MRRSSLRTWLLLVAVLFASLVVGGVALTTYVVVSDGMAVVVHDSTVRIAQGAAEILKVTANNAQLSAASAGIADPQERAAEANRIFVREIPEMFRASGLSEGEFAYYDASLRPVWSTAESALFPDTAEDRRRAVEERQTIESTLDRSGSLSGLIRSARLDLYVIHMPFDIPGGGTGVLDITYYPDREEAVIDNIRMPMFTLAMSALFIMVVMMQTSMNWVLKLVDDLRRAADSIDAGNLNVHLPEEGEHEIGDLARSLNSLIDRLRRRSEAQTRFVADASHELATPVAGIRGYTNILRAWGGDDPDVREEAISAIDRESRRMARLCSDLLALVRDERGLEFRNVRFDLNVRCREVLAAAATRYIDKGLEFIGPGEGQLSMVGDPDRIEDAVSILVDNAAKYTPSGTITLSTRRRRDTIVIEVTDTGIGIPADDLPNIFDRFYRSDESRSKQTGGFGLGLPIAKTIIDGAGGVLEVESTLGKGSTFTIRLPRGRI